MNKVMTAKIVGLALSCAFFTGIADAGEELDAVNAEVEKKAEQIDQMYGVLLTTQERDNLKIALIVKKVATVEAAESKKPVKEIIDTAITTYEIEDTTEQRKLLIETEAAMAEFGGNGTQPPCCG